MTSPTENLQSLAQAQVESAGRLAAISVESAQRAFALQIGFARQALDYSQSLLEIASQARTRIGKLAEERMDTTRETLAPAGAGMKRGTTTKRRRK